MRWTVVVAMRSLPSAKSRLADASPDPQAHNRLVEAIRHDTLAAVETARTVTRIVLVVDRPIKSGYDTHVQRRPGLNAALTEAQHWAIRRWPADAVAALVGRPAP